MFESLCQVLYTQQTLSLFTPLTNKLSVELLAGRGLLQHVEQLLRDLDDLVQVAKQGVHHVISHRALQTEAHTAWLHKHCRLEKRAVCNIKG